MRHVFCRKIVFLLAALLVVCGMSARKPIKTLLITGQNNHNWQVSHVVLKQILENSGRFSVDFAVSPEAGKDMSGFVLDFSPYELLALQWDDLDFETGVLTISKQVSLVRGKIVMSVPKTKSSIRKLVLPPAVVQVLKEYRESNHSRWMFPSPVLEDLPLNPGSVYDRLQLILEHANCKQVRFHDLRHTFATLALQNGMDVKTLSAMLGHVSAATTLDIYTHATSDMQHAAARKIDCGIGKAELPDEPAPQANAPAIVDFQPYMGKVRKPGTGCISQINDHLFEGRYSPTWIDGKKHARNVYAHTREECEEKLKVLIAEMKAELAELKRQKADRH